MQSCLEKRSIEERNKEKVRSDYNSDNQYSATHPNALATGDKHGKGTGHKGHTFWLPNCSGSIGIINYSNFDTSVESGAGNSDDNNARKVALTRSLYSNENPYSSKLIDTTENIKDGQYFVP